jgi:hypothetical protein
VSEQETIDQLMAILIKYATHVWSTPASAQNPEQATDLVPIKRTPTNIGIMFHDMCDCIARLSVCFKDQKMGEISKSMSMGLALIHRVFRSALNDCIDTDLDGPFFKTVLRFLNINDEDQRVMSKIENYIEQFEENWKDICYRAGLSFDRKKILLFLQSLYGTDLKNCIMILKTFIGSGKTASLSLFMLLSLMNGESAVYMTPSSNEVLRFFFGILVQIKDLINSDEFRSFPKGDFKTKMIELEMKLRNLRIYTQPLKFGEVLDKDVISIFVLASTVEIFAYVLGNSCVFKMFVFDDITYSRELARQISLNQSKSTIFIAGADDED